MSLRDICIKKSYSSDSDDILQEFYIPVLSNSVEYCRLAGFFSSSSLAIAARGILGLIKNGGNMKMIVCPKLTKEELDAIIDAKENPEKYIENKMIDELEKLEDEFIRDHVYALGWLIAHNRLEIKVAIVNDEKGKLLSYDEIQASGIFHQKVGILKDKDGNIVTFSGSINETATGWLKNVEEFKVFRNWIETEKDYVDADIKKFMNFWNGTSKRVRIINIPEAVKEKLITLTPKNIDDINLDKWYHTYRCKREKIELYPYQKNAINAWIENNMCGIFEMATGTGKTFTALGCVDKVFAKKTKVLLIITCPYQHLLCQWKNEIEKFGIVYDKIIEAHSRKKWKNHLADLLVDLHLGHVNRVIVLTTHRTFSSDNFVRIMKDNKGDFSIFLIADEVHWLGAEESRKGLIEEYDFKLGLSATPKRWFDDEGTRVIYNYFGDVVFEFSLKDAITKINPSTGFTFLTPYRYVPYFVSLTDDELNEYFEKTKSIAQRYSQANNDDTKNAILESLLFRRADILKNAFMKYKTLEDILEKLGKDVKHVIIYCTPQQIDRVMEIVNQRGLISHRFTMDEDITPNEKYNGLSEREYILQKFAEGEYQVLVAMKCLDEGVDVPPAKIAILMASSGNPREYIQRIGRVIRRYPNKNEAIIYDMIVAPSLNRKLPPELKNLEKKIFEKELKRYEEIAQIAINNAEAISVIYKIKNWGGDI